MSDFSHDSQALEEALLILPAAVILKDKDLPIFVKNLCIELTEKTYLSVGDWLQKADFYSLHAAKDSFEKFEERTVLMKTLVFNSGKALSVKTLQEISLASVEAGFVKHNPEIRFLLSAYLTSLFLQGEGFSGLATASFVKRAHSTLNTLIATEILKRRHFDVTLDYSNCSLVLSSENPQDITLNGIIKRGPNFNQQLKTALSLFPNTVEEEKEQKKTVKQVVANAIEKLRFWKKE